MKLHSALALFVILSVPGVARPDVVDSSATGFTTKTTLTIQGTPDSVYRAFLHVGD